MKPAKSIIFTKSGYGELQKKYQLLLEERKNTVEQLKKAREMGDLSENGFYKAAKAKLGSVDHQISVSHYLLRFGIVSEPENHGTIQIGRTAIIKDSVHQKEITLVGEHEANPLLGKISHHSPLGKALLGKKKGDNVLVQSPRGEAMYTIVKIT